MRMSSVSRSAARIPLFHGENAGAYRSQDISGLDKDAKHTYRRRSDDGFSYQLLQAPTRTSGVTKLCLRRAVLTLRSLGTILNTTATLTLLVFPGIIPHLLRHLAHRPALAPLRNTLRLLHIIIDKGWFESCRRATVIARIGSFSDWPLLRKLRVQRLHRYPPPRSIPCLLDCGSWGPLKLGIGRRR